MNAIVSAKSFNGNQIDITIYSNTIRSLLDTGADSNNLSEKLFNELPSHAQQKLYVGPQNTCRTAPGEILHVLGQITIPVYIVGTRFNDEFSVVRNMTWKCILGMPFLQKCGVNIDISVNTLTISKAVPVVSKNTLTIPTCTQIICPGQLQCAAHFPNNTVGELTCFPVVYDKQILHQIYPNQCLAWFAYERY